MAIIFRLNEFINFIYLFSIGLGAISRSIWQIYGSQ